MKRLILILTVCVLAVSGYYAYPIVLSSLFKISGTVNIIARLEKQAKKPNTVCFLVAKNDGDVPVAIQRIVNPEFPFNFTLTKKDLLIPDAWKSAMKIEVYLNRHGEVGKLKAGDMFTGSKKIAKMLDKNVDITVDKMMGIPSLYLRGKYYDKSYRLFRTAAR